jgi:protein-tyrosine phosphatase
MSRAGVNIVIPGKLYQRGHFLTWPAAQKHRLFKDTGITMVVNLWSKVDPDLSADQAGRIYLCWLCSPSAVPPDADRMTDAVASLIGGGHRALIHCEAGRGRSVWFSARVLAAVTGISGAEALEAIKVACPSYKLNPPLINDLKEYRA